MTGHQDHAATGKTLKGQVVPAIHIYGLCRSLGIEHVCEVDAFDQAELERVIKEEAVSYTHLDVYKRQALGQSQIATPIAGYSHSSIINWLPNSPHKELGFSLPIPKIPVIDVYKRQIQGL